MTTIQINGTDYPIKFSVSVIMRYAQSQGMETMDEFQEWISNIDPQKFSELEKMCGLFLSAFKKGCKMENTPCDLEVDDVFDALSDNPKVFEDVMAEFTRSQESEPTNAGNQPGEEENEQKKSQ